MIGEKSNVRENLKDGVEHLILIISSMLTELFIEQQDSDTIMHSTINCCHIITIHIDVSVQIEVVLSMYMMPSVHGIE